MSEPKNLRGLPVAAASDLEMLERTLLDGIADERRMMVKVRERQLQAEELGEAFMASDTQSAHAAFVMARESYMAAFKLLQLQMTEVGRLARAYGIALGIEGVS